jgi:hypothetical protein
VTTPFVTLPNLFKVSFHFVRLVFIFHRLSLQPLFTGSRFFFPLFFHHFQFFLAFLPLPLNFPTCRRTEVRRVKKHPTNLGVASSSQAIRSIVSPPDLVVWLWTYCSIWHKINCVNQVPISPPPKWNLLPPTICHCFFPCSRSVTYGLPGSGTVIICCRPGSLIFFKIVQGSIFLFESDIYFPPFLKIIFSPFLVTHHSLHLLCPFCLIFF